VDDQQFKQLSDKIDTIIKLLALNTVQGKQLKDQVSVLSSLGLRPKQIADMLGKTPNNISVTLYKLRKERGEPEVEEMTEDNERTEDEWHV